MIPQNQHQWASAVDLLNLLPTQTISGSSAVDGAGHDLIDHHGTALAILDAEASATGQVAVKLQTAPDTDQVTRASVTYAGTGNGHLSVAAGPDPVAENITFTASSATSFAVAGSVSGALGTLTVGTAFSKPQVNAYIAAGSTPFVSGDVFTVPTTARTWTDGPTLATVTAAARAKGTINLDTSGRYVRAVATPSGTTPSSVLSVNLLAPIQSA